MLFFFFNDTATTEIYTLSLHDALPILDDRNLDVYAVELGRRRDLFGAARYLKSGDFIRNESVRQYRTERIRLETEPDLPINIDGDRKSTRLNSSHANISYAGFCLKKKKNIE